MTPNSKETQSLKFKIELVSH